MKRILSVFLAVLLLCGMTLPAYAAAEASGTTIRLSETSGTTTVRDATGKEISVKADMRLYNGYAVETDTKSSAYLTLDGTKAVKLDSSTHVEVKKNGKQLEISLVAGNVFFSVEEPLNTDESFNIRTSTMVTGIRGSYGWVNPFEAGMIHGRGTVTCTNPVSGESRTTEITSGEGVRYEAQTEQPSSTGESTSDEELKEIDFDKTKLTVTDMPAIAAEEIAADPVKQEQIQQDVPNLNAREIVESADEKRAQEDAAQEAAQETVTAELAAQDQLIAANDAADAAAGIKDEVKFKEENAETSPSSGGGDGGGGGGGGSSTPAVPTDGAALNSALAGGNASVTVSGAMNYANVTVPAGKTLTLTAGTGTSNTVTMANLNNTGTIVVGAGVTLTVTGTGTELGTITNSGTLAVSGSDVVQHGTITNDGTVTNGAETAMLGSVVNNGTYNNSGTLAIAPGMSFTGGTVNNTGTIIVDQNATFSPAPDGVSGSGKVIRNQGA